MTKVDPQLAREFAVDVVRQLRAAGHQALWAGGCVRDQLMRTPPKDYDVATDATPPTLERYLYQFRLGPDKQTISKLLACMTPDRKALWAGAKSDRVEEGGY